MNTGDIITISPKVKPPLDSSFRPAVLWNRAFHEAIRDFGGGAPLIIGVERGDGSLSRFETVVFAEAHPLAEASLFYAERLVKSLLWMKGGFHVIVGGPRRIGEHIKAVYSAKGARSFDADLMSTAYLRPFRVTIADADKVPPRRETTRPLGRHFDGCRIGFDLGASDRKVCAVIDGEPVFAEEVPWEPQPQTDPEYHFHQIMSGLHQAASHLPRVDAIGGSAAGIYIDNQPRVASLFRGIPRGVFRRRVTKLFERIRKAWGVPLDIVNDGEVTALAGSMSLSANRVLGISMGSSLAGGFVNAQGRITAWLNELAFVPVDFRPGAPADEWSGDIGCGVQYFSQQAVFRLAAAAGIKLKKSLAAADLLKTVQDLLAKGDERAERIFETIGCYFGYAIALYADFYDVGLVLVLGRVTSGDGGPIILKNAKKVLEKEFPELAAAMELHLPDEKRRRVGQAVAAASLPLIPKKQGKQ